MEEGGVGVFQVADHLAVLDLGVVEEGQVAPPGLLMGTVQGPGHVLGGQLTTVLVLALLEMDALTDGKGVDLAVLADGPVSGQAGQIVHRIGSLLDQRVAILEADLVAGGAVGQHGVQGAGVDGAVEGHLQLAAVDGLTGVGGGGGIGRRGGVRGGRGGGGGTGAASGAAGQAAYHKGAAEDQCK